MNKDENKYSILIVENKEGDFLLMKKYLEDQINDVTIYHATSFEIAKHYLTSNNKKPIDVVLLSLCLPDIYSRDLIMKITPFCKKIPVIVLTSNNDINFSIESISKGIADYLLKESLTAASLYKSIVHCIERLKKNIELTESEKRYNELFHLSPLPMWVYDIETLAFLDVNEAAIKHYGYSKKDFFSMTLREIRPIEDFPLFDSQRINAINHSKRFMPGIIKHIKKNGDVIYVEVKSTYLTFKGRDASVILVNDVTDKLKYISEIESKNKELQDIAWLQSHVIRAPVAKILGIVNLIQSIHLSEVEKTDLLSNLYSCTQELDIVIHNIACKTNSAKINYAKIN